MNEIEKEDLRPSDIAKDHLQEPSADYPKTDMESAAVLLLNDYLNDDELTAFTALDIETFHETR
ncbi:MAG: hypothetical protein IPH12_21880 [Saprospirales bacterium]|nr:hypothetical protein [Saprospirales bacterium]MBK8920520.1 hypothetical protein [Saprospirales bacterium]